MKKYLKCSSLTLEQLVLDIDSLVRYSMEHRLSWLKRRRSYVQSMIILAWWTEYLNSYINQSILLKDLLWERITFNRWWNIQWQRRCWSRSNSTINARYLNLFKFTGIKQLAFSKIELITLTFLHLELVKQMNKETSICLKLIQSLSKLLKKECYLK